jgi:hypothetical protein
MRVPAIVACLALAACGDKEADPRGVDRDEVLLQVTASGRADTRPDEARFTVGVETFAADAAEAGSRNGETIRKVTAALAGLGIKDDDLQTRAVTLNRVDYGPKRGQFHANNLIEVRMRDMKRAGEAIAAATQAGGNVLSGPNLTVSDPEAASRSAYAQAYKAARARAEAYAQAAGLKVGRVLAIRDGGEGRSHYPPPISMEASAQLVSPPPPPEEPPFHPGMNRSEVRIRADFALVGG